ncbi:hypothetical protein TBR22_A21470 [Luteitalea sp. TBR-22]|nr:hypothetical protein TBR22_A21470 [Luteitalea sp. TBR-22]
MGGLYTQPASLLNANEGPDAPPGGRRSRSVRNVDTRRPETQNLRIRHDRETGRP